MILLCHGLFACGESSNSFVSGRLSAGGLERNYVLHFPAGKTSAIGLPVVLVLHGGGGNAENIARTTRWNDKSDREGFVVVYPNGTGRFQNRFLTWNSGNCCGYARENSVDDVKFLGALIDVLKTKYKVDRDRIFVTGLSNGAMMTYRAACELSAEIAAIAPVAGALNLACHPKDPVSVLVFHGTADEHVLYEGGQGKKQVDPTPRVDASVASAVNFWVKADRCSATPVEKTRGKIVSRDYTGCTKGTEVKLFTIIDGGHAWPGGAKGSPWADEPTREISATDEIWAFFKAHPKSKIP